MSYNELLYSVLSQLQQKFPIKFNMFLLVCDKCYYFLVDQFTFKRKRRDFPAGTVVKNAPANAGDTGSVPGPGRSNMPRRS